MNEIAPGVACLPLRIANVYFVGSPGAAWTLVDTGTPSSANKIQAAAQERYGAGARPEAIILTHGHFDHAGSATELADAWGVPIYAHRLELPFLTGRAMYPPRDPTVGGALAFLSRFFPANGLDLGDRIRALPPEGALPGMPGWEWLDTPGHSPGHISLFRVGDQTLLAGDAFSLVNLDSVLAVATKKSKISLPPAAITCDWGAAQSSVQRLEGLKPMVIGCGHGLPRTGGTLADELHAFADHFPTPAHGRYVSEPARTDENGIVSLPPPAPDPLPKQLAAGAGVTALAGTLLAWDKRRRRDD